jgi:hypothetical protein
MTDAEVRCAMVCANKGHSAGPVFCDSYGARHPAYAPNLRATDGAFRQRVSRGPYFPAWDVVSDALRVRRSRAALQGGAQNQAAQPAK